MSGHKIRYGLTQPQQRVWYSEKLYPGTGMWNNAGTIKIRGRLDYVLLNKALNLFVEENESIRLRIRLDGETPYQYIADYKERDFDVFDFSIKGAEQMYEWDEMQTQAPMPIVDSRLYYFALIKLREDEGAVYLKFHHIISDGLSIVQFTSRVMSTYETLLRGGQCESSDAKSYIDYIEKEEKYLKSKRFLKDQTYWLDAYEEVPEPTVVKQKKTNYFSTRAERKVRVIDEELSNDIKAYCMKNSLSPFMLFLSAMGIYINRISGKDDIVIGAPVANRTSKNGKGTFGMYISTVPVRMKIEDDLTFADFAQYVSGRWFSVLKHQKYPYNMLLRELRKKHKGLESLYDITLSYQIGTLEKGAEQFTYEGRWHFSGYQANSLNIHFNDREAAGKLIVDYDHHAPFFSGKEIDYFHAHLIKLLKDVLSHPDKKLYNLELLTNDERERILGSFNDTGSSFPENETYTGMWQDCIRSVDRSKNAVVFKDEALTYGELDRRSDALAAYMKEQGIGAEDIVGLLISRHPDYFVCMLGVLKAGAAFLPIDTQLPEERKLYMLLDSGAKAVIASPENEESLSGIDIPVISTKTDIELYYDVPVECICRPETLAYVIYTSGSTGQPKGVQIEHHSFTHFMHMMKQSWDYSQGAKVLCAASFCFDMSIMEAMPALVFGAEVVLAAEDEANIPKNIVSLIKKTGANIMMATPGRMELLLTDPQGAVSLRNFRDIGLGGDVLSEKLLAKVQESTNARITNFYGPTEITVCATCTDVTNAKVPNIGKPMQDVKVYILDTHQNPVPIGVPGELYVGGKGVARGYINKPELNAERFIDNPFGSGRLYRTGDLTRWYPLGEIEFLGRIDKQVKIRGYRIELGEIENRLQQIDGIDSCVVADYSDASDRKFLAAFVCGQPPASADIKTALQKELPKYMIPSYFVTLDELPFSASGKVDKSRLPNPLDGVEMERKELVPPKTQTERELADIWKSVLGIEQIDRSDSFFDIGGDSLSIVMVMARIPQKFQVEIKLEDVYKNPQLKTFAAIIDAAEHSTHRPIIKAPESEDYPSSSAQQRMWILQQADKQSTAYNIPMTFEIQGEPDYQGITRALKKLIERHDILRTAFVRKGAALRQKIYDNVDFEIEQIECLDAAAEKEVKGLIKPFDMSSAPLMRAAFIKTEQRNLLFLDMHHSISDRRSAEIMFEDLAALYEGKPLGEKEYEYKDYAVWQQEHLESDSTRLQKEYWGDTLTGELPLLNIHTDKQRAAVQQFVGKRIEFDISRKTAEKLKGFAAAKGATMFTAILAVYNVLLSKYTGQEDIIVGTPVAGRSRPEVSDIMGVFINTIPLRNYPKSDMSFSEFFDELKQNTVSAIANSDYPLERMIADVSVPRDISRNPLFDTMLVFNAESVKMELGDMSLSYYPVDPGYSKLDITLEAYESSDGLKCQFEYNTGLFKKGTIKRISRHLKRLFDILADEPDIRLKDIGMLTQDELKQVTKGFNKTYRRLGDVSLQSILERVALEQPEKTALICEGRSMSFAELNARANSIAHVLRNSGVKRNTIVALHMCRSFDMVAGLFGVLKAGGAYMPLDPTYPEDRIEFMLSDSGAQVLLTDGTGEVNFERKVIDVRKIEEKECGNLERIDTAEDSAYVIYTSGSTGKPKGAALSRKAMYNLYLSTGESIRYDKDQVCISVTTVAFDIFVTDCVMPLLFGCSVVMCNEEEQRQPHLTAQLIERCGVGYIQTTPTRMRIMMDNEKFRAAASAHFGKIVLAGEMIPPSLLKQLQDETAAQIINGYGPTETTVYSSFKDLTTADKVTIGRPALNTQMYILDKNKMPVPIGVLGELYIGGAGVCGGYINRRKLTQERFLPDPYRQGHMMYRTGDVCVFAEDGDIEICGRIDHQIKIRGLRIELGEIEAAIRSVDGVNEVVVKDWGEDIDKYLCAYYSSDKQIDEQAMRSMLTEKLPVYMVPGFFVSMEKLPTTLNGKVDRKALAEPDKKDMHRRTVDKSDMSETELKMSRIWSEILGVGDVGPDDNFFELGGDSFAVINVQAALYQYDWEISTKDFYSAQTLRRVCKCINVQSESSAYEDINDKLDVPVPEYEHLKPADAKNVLLTGATGFLGAHLLEELVSRGSLVRCLVRGADSADAKKRLAQRLEFYFGTERADEIMSRTGVVCSDISEDGLGISGEEADSLSDADTIIHSAAITDHMGEAGVFEKANVTGTLNIVRLSEKIGAVLVHMSTTGVSGTHFALKGKRKGVFKENSYYVGQNWNDNIYIETKFRAEKIVLDAMENGLNARIMRIGMLTATMDGKFQKRPERNAFANRLKAICALGCLPAGMLGAELNMTPVDVCAKAVIELMRTQRKAVYHVYNTNKMTLADVIGLLEQTGRSIEIVSDEEFAGRISEYSRRGELKHIKSLMDDIKSKQPQISVTAEATGLELKQLGFSWPVIDANYLGVFMSSIA